MISDDKEWFKTAVFYEVLVRSFRDSDGDGTGDFQGLIEKLDYLELAGRRLPVGAPRSSPHPCATVGTTSPTTPTSSPRSARSRTSGY